MPKVRGEEWSHVVDNGLDKNRNHIFTCKYCDRKFTGSASKIRIHLLGCVSTPVDVVLEMRNKRDMRDAINQASAGVRKNTTQASLRNQLTILKMNEKGAKNKLDEAIADFFFGAGLPFSKIDCPFFKNMVTALKASPVSYQPPNSKRLKGPILESRYNDAQKKLQGFSGTNVTLCSDGWSTLDEKKIINFVIGNSENVCFVKSIDCSGEVTSSDFIFEKIKEVIENLAAKEITVVAVSTDTAANMKAARARLTAELGVFSIPCLCHVLDLVVEDIGGLQWAKKIIERADLVNGYIRSKEKLHVWIKDNSAFKKGLKKKSRTRFFTVKIVLDRLLEQRSNLEGCFLSEPAKYVRAQHSVKDRAEKFDRVKSMIMSQEYWDDIEYLLNIMKTPCIILRAADNPKNPVIGYVYNLFLRIQEEWRLDEAIKGTHKKDMANIVKKRWADGHTELHSAAYLLNPRFVRYPLFDDKAIIEDFKNVVQRCGVSTATALHELESYRVHFNTEGASIYQQDGDHDDLQKLPNPLTYWRYYAEESMVALPKVAKVIFNTLSSSSVCEQSFRDHEYLYSNRRLRTNIDRFQKLVFLYSNRRLTTCLNK